MGCSVCICAIFIFVVGSVVTAQVIGKCPDQLLPIAGKSEIYQFSSSPTDIVEYTVCGFISQTCGTDPGSNYCSSQASNCAIACQLWSDPNDPGAGATLGQNFLSSTVTAREIVVVYAHGDAVVDQSTGASTPRQITMHFVCGKSTMQAIKFVQAQITNPPPPVYDYVLYVETKYACGGVNSCDSIQSCTGCTTPQANISGSPCAYCFDDNACHSLAEIRKNHSCDNYATSKTSCPGNVCTGFNSCKSCAGYKFNGGRCYWCDSNIKSRCDVDGDWSTCDGGEFRNSTLCPRR